MSKVLRVAYVHENTSGDWAALYINHSLVWENHSMDASLLLRYIRDYYRPGDSLDLDFYAVEMSHEDIELGRGFPFNEKDIPEDLITWRQGA